MIHENCKFEIIHSIIGVSIASDSNVTNMKVL